MNNYCVMYVIWQGLYQTPGSSSYSLLATFTIFCIEKIASSSKSSNSLITSYNSSFYVSLKCFFNACAIAICPARTIQPHPASVTNPSPSLFLIYRKPERYVIQMVVLYRLKINSLTSLWLVGLDVNFSPRILSY